MGKSDGFLLPDNHRPRFQQYTKKIPGCTDITEKRKLLSLKIKDLLKTFGESLWLFNAALETPGFVVLFDAQATVFDSLNAPTSCFAIL